MKNFSNIYDVDGNIIRKAGDTHRFTIEEVEKLVDDLTKKVQDNPDNEVYKVYLDNAHKWLYNMYNNMSTKDIMERISALQNNVQEVKDDINDAEKQQLEEISKAMEQLKAEYDADQSDSSPVLEDNKGRINDEYVEFEEVKDDEGTLVD